MVAERKRVDRLEKDLTSTPEGVPLPSYRNGRERGVRAQNYPSEGITLIRSFIAVCQNRLAMWPARKC